MDSSGAITVEECLYKARSINKEAAEVKIKLEDVKQFIEKVDIDRSGEISYSQFLCATLTD